MDWIKLALDRVTKIRTSFIGGEFPEQVLKNYSNSWSHSLLFLYPFSEVEISTSSKCHDSESSQVPGQRRSPRTEVLPFWRDSSQNPGIVADNWQGRSGELGERACRNATLFTVIPLQREIGKWRPVGQIPWPYREDSVKTREVSGSNFGRVTGYISLRISRVLYSLQQITESTSK